MVCTRWYREAVYTGRYTYPGIPGKHIARYTLPGYTREAYSPVHTSGYTGRRIARYTPQGTQGGIPGWYLSYTQGGIPGWYLSAYKP